MMTCPPVSSFISSVSTLTAVLLPVTNGGSPRCSGSPSASPKHPSASACSSSHCAAEKYQWKLWKIYAKLCGDFCCNDFQTADRKTRTKNSKPAECSVFSQTARSFGPAYLAASGVMSPQFSIPPEEHPAVRTRMSREISSLSVPRSRHHVRLQSGWSIPPHRQDL